MIVLICESIIQDEEIKNNIKHRINKIEENIMNDNIKNELKILQERKEKRKINNYQQESINNIVKKKKVKV